MTLDQFLAIYYRIQHWRNMDTFYGTRLYEIGLSAEDNFVIWERASGRETPMSFPTLSAAEECQFDIGSDELVEFLKVWQVLSSTLKMNIASKRLT